MLFLAGAVAAYAWRSRSRSRSAGDRSRRPGEARGTGDPGRRGGDGAETGDGHAGAGITDLPPGAEASQQSSLPPRGERKPGVRA
jgi:hypothetical protein